MFVHVFVEKIFNGSHKKKRYATNYFTNFYDRCAFWDFNVADWNTSGCALANVISTNASGNISTEVTCHCNHLTNFAVLLSYDSSEKPVRIYLQ